MEQGLAIVSATPSQGTYDANTGAWTVGTMVAQQTVSLTIVANATEIGQHTNSVSLSSVDQADTDPSNNSANASIIVVHEADLAIEKVNNPSTAQPGSAVVYDITVRNLGPNDATGVSAHDPLIIDAQITGVRLPPGTSFDAATRVWSIGDLAVGDSVTLEVTIQVRPGRSGTFTNTVVVSTSDLPDPDVTNNQANATLFVPTADIAVSKAVSPGTAFLGDEVTFVVGVDNLGPDLAEGVTVSDLLPAGLTFVSAQPSVGSYDAATGTWTIGDLQPVQLVPRAVASETTLTIIARSVQLGTFTNTAFSDRAQSFPFDLDPTNNEASAVVTVVLPPVDVSITKSVSPAAATVGQSITFTLVVSNAGPAAAAGVVVADELPAGLIATAGSDPACAIAGANLSCAFGTLASGATRTFTVTATTSIVGTIVNLAMVATANPDTDPGNNVGSASVTVTPPVQPVAELKLTKVASTTTATVGDFVTFTLRLDNLGPDPATDVVIRDPMPQGLTPVDAPPACTIVGQLVTCTTPTVVANGVFTVDVVARVDTAAQFVNVATATAATSAASSPPVESQAGVLGQPSGGGLPATGGDIGLFAQLATAMVGLGLLLRWRARRI